MKGLAGIVSFYVFFSSISFLKEVSMANKDLKKFLAGLGVAGLIAAGGVSLPGAHAAGSGWGASKDSAGSAEKVMKPAGSGWGGSKDSAVSAAKEDGKEDAGKEGLKAAVDETVKKPVKKAAIEGC